MNEFSCGLGEIRWIGFEWGSDLKGYEVQFVTTMLAHQTTLLVVLVAKWFKKASKAYSLRRCQASDRDTSFLARRGLGVALTVLVVEGLDVVLLTTC